MVVSSEPVVSPRRRRSVLSPAQKYVLIGMIAGGAILGVLSPGEPTGHSVIDAAYRALFVGALGMAASRSRRWALIIAAAVATAGSIGLGLIFGATALLMAVFLVGRNLRNRLYGTCIGVFVAMACLRLEVDLFVGSSALIAAVAAGFVLWSGYRMSRTRSRKLCRRAVGIALLLGAVGVGLGVYEAVTVVSPLEAAVNATAQGVTLAKSGETGSAGLKFERARRDFQKVSDTTSKWWLYPTRLVPLLSQNLAVIPAVSRAGASLTEAATTMSAEVDYSRIRREGGGVDLAMLAGMREPVLEVAERLADASEKVDRIRTPWIVQPLTTRLDEFDDKVADLQSQTALAALALEHGPSMFGGSGERRYLLLLGNPAELRDLGGHIGNVAEVSIVDGTLSLTRVDRPLELSRPELAGALAESGDLPPSVLALDPAKFPQNWGASIDFPTDAKMAARLYQNAVGRSVDGVIYADPFALAAMLSVTGPISIPGLGQQLTSDNAVQFLTRDQFTAYPTQSAADEAVTDLVQDVFEKLVATTLPGPSDLGARFGPLVKEGRFRMVSLHPEDEPLLSRLGLDNGFAAVEGQDLLAVVTRNANPSKIDTFLHRSVAYAVDWNSANGAVRSTVSVTLKNDAPATGLPAYVIGNSANLPFGTNISDLAIVTPFEATQATVDGVDTDVSPVREGNVWRHTVRVEIPPGGSVTVRVELEGDVEPGSTYRLHVSGQPMVNPGSFNVAVDGAAGDIVPGPGIRVAGSTATATLSDAGQTILTLSESK